MYLYFDKNGILKEVINDSALRQGSDAVNKVYAYFEGDRIINGVYFNILRNGDTSPIRHAYTTLETSQIPYSASRTLNYFKYFVNYNFYTYTFDSTDLAVDGVLKLTIQAYDNADAVFALGLVLLSVEASAVAITSEITVSEYQDLLKSIANCPTWSALENYIGLSRSDLQGLTFANVKAYIDSYHVAGVDNTMLTGVLTTAVTLNNGTSKSSSIDLSNSFYLKGLTYSKEEADAKFTSTVNVYNKNEIDNLLNNKANTTYVDQKDFTLQTNIDTEATTRANADTHLQNQIDTIEAGKNVADIIGTYAELEAYPITNIAVGDIIQVMADETQGGSTSNYRLTSKSPKTWILIGSEAPTYTKTESDNKFATKTDLATTNNNVSENTNKINTNTSDIATLQSTQNKVQQLDFTGTLSADVLTFESGTIYDLVDNTFYELDLHFSASGTINDNTSVSLVNNSTTITLNSILGSVVGSFRQVQKYLPEIGYRWVFLALFNTSNGVSTFTILPTINRQDILCLKGSEITSTLINGLANNQVILCTESGNTYVLGHLYLATCDFTNNTITLSDKSIFVPTKTSELTNDTGYITATNYAGETVGGVILAKGLTGSETDLVEVKIDPVTHKLYAPSIPTICVEIVASLPATGVDGTLYLVPIADPTSTNHYKEYVWANSAWEELGAVTIDLSSYATLTYVNAQLALKQNVIDTNNKLSASNVSGLATVATSGSYNDLTNKPTIISNFDISGTVASDGTITFNSLVVADLITAITSKAIITFVPTNNDLNPVKLSYKVSSGVYTLIGSYSINNSSVIYSYECMITVIDSVADGSMTVLSAQPSLVSGTNIKTIGGVSVLGSGDIPAPTSGYKQTFNVDGSEWGNCYKGLNEMLKEDDMGKPADTYVGQTVTIFKSWQLNGVDVAYPKQITGANSYSAIFESGSNASDIANLSWDTIIALAKIKAFDSTHLGQTTQLDIGGVAYTVQIIGVNHDDLTDGTGKANLTFELKYLLANNYKMNATDTNSGGWEASAMRTNVLPNILSQMPTNIQNAIKSVNKANCKVYDNATITYTSDKLFLLSEAEVFGVKTNAAALEGTRYEYWANNNTATARIKYQGEGGTTAAYWWLRSPYSNNSGSFCSVSASGSVSDNGASYTKGVSLAFDL